ncbi:MULTISPECIES: hypothetical protein [Rhodococcus]|uniref:hypothetical protein n=1 Tax=Rhodococcus TaxID=1827 RepID=UPI000ABCBA15|nr:MULTISPECIES: hypothetical protein [Rhodococcus]
MARNAHSPCDYPDCLRTPYDGYALYRVNAKGRPGVFMCEAHADKVKKAGGYR